MEVIRHVPFDEQTRAEGRDWPARAESMAGLRRLENLQFCVTDVLRRRVPGDLIETGAGLPRPDPERWPAEAGDEHWTRGELAVPLEEVQATFAPPRQPRHHRPDGDVDWTGVYRQRS
jgi:O-methyltransferase